MSEVRCIWSMHAIAVRSTGTDFWKVAVPDIAGAFAQQHPLRFRSVSRLLEQAEFYPFSVLGHHRKIGPLAIPGGAQGSREAGPDARHVYATSLGKRATLRLTRVTVNARRRTESGEHGEGG